MAASDKAKCMFRAGMHRPLLTPVLPNVSDRGESAQGGDVHVSRSRGLAQAVLKISLTPTVTLSSSHCRGAKGFRIRLTVGGQPPPG